MILNKIFKKKNFYPPNHIFNFLLNILIEGGEKQTQNSASFHIFVNLSVI